MFCEELDLAVIDLSKNDCFHAKLKELENMVVLLDNVKDDEALGGRANKDMIVHFKASYLDQLKTGQDIWTFIQKNSPKRFLTMEAARLEATQEFYRKVAYDRMMRAVEEKATILINAAIDKQC
eukprot:2361156-Pyramimonas_sp.AAC.1